MEEEKAVRSPSTLSKLIDIAADWFAVIVRISWLIGALFFAIHTYGWLRFGEWKPFQLRHVFPQLFSEQVITGWVTIDYVILHTASWPLWLVIPATTMLMFFGLMMMGDNVDAKNRKTV